jgi:hypothetical protein
MVQPRSGGITGRVRAAPFLFILLFVVFLLWAMDDIGPGW